MADKDITLGESLANQMSEVSSLATTTLQSLPIKDKNKDITLKLKKSLADQMSEVSSLATTSLQSLSLPLLPPCFSHQELILLLRRQRKASLGMEDKTTILLLLTELACHGLARPDFFTRQETNSLKARSSLLKLMADEWNWLLWSRMNTISSRKPSKEAATVLHSVLSRCLGVLPADCPFRMGNHVGQFFRMYELKKPLVTNVEGTGSNAQETPLIYKFLMHQPVKKEIAADPDYHPDSITDAENHSGLLSKEGKSNVERENAWQAIGFAAVEKPSACSECWGCLRNKQCFEVTKWERKQAANLKDQNSPSLFLARARASATIASHKAEESLSQDSLPSVNSFSPPLTEKGAASQETIPLVGSFIASSLSGTSSANPSSQSSYPAKFRASSPTGDFWKNRPGSSPPGSSLPGSSLPGSSLPGSSPPGNPPAGSASASSSPLNQENVPMRTDLLEDTATTCHKTMRHSSPENPKEKLSCSSTKATPLVEINNNRKRRQPLDFSSAFVNKKGARRVDVDEVDLPCTCDDCRYVTAPHVGRMLVKGIFCRCHPCKLSRDRKAGDDLKV